MNLIIFSSVKRIHSVLLILKLNFCMAEFNYLHVYDLAVVDINLQTFNMKYYTKSIKYRNIVAEKIFIILMI